MSLSDIKPLTAQEKKELRALKHRPIDFSDIPEITDEQWDLAVAMPPMTQFNSAKEWQAHYRKELAKKKAAYNGSAKRNISLALEPEVYAWVQSQGKDAPLRINALLKDYIHMLQQQAH